MAINSHLIGITKSIPIFPENCNGFVTKCNILARMVLQTILKCNPALKTTRRIPQIIGKPFLSFIHSLRMILHKNKQLVDSLLFEEMVLRSHNFLLHEDNKHKIYTHPLPQDEGVCSPQIEIAYPPWVTAHRRAASLCKDAPALLKSALLFPTPQFVPDT